MTRRVCVCTSYAATAEPRAVRHAVALARADRDRHVVFVDCLPEGVESAEPHEFRELPNVEYFSHRFSHRAGSLGRLTLHKGARAIARTRFVLGEHLTAPALSTRMSGFERRLASIGADVYVAHNIDTLLPAAHAAAGRGAALIFDCMEFYSDMGDSQSRVDKRLIGCIEQRYLHRCDLVLASSPELADALAKRYAIRPPLALYNAPPCAPRVHRTPNIGLSLYWRNSTIGLGERGLEDAFAALTLLPHDVTLHLQGRLDADGGRALRTAVARHGIGERVQIHPPHEPSEAVAMASRFDVGLCLERDTNLNHRLTVSNKLFDYLMAGAVVVASDLPGLRSVISRSGGLLFRSGAPADLADKIALLHRDRARLAAIQERGRSFALAHGNREHEMTRFLAAYDDMMTSREKTGRDGGSRSRIAPEGACATS